MKSLTVASKWVLVVGGLVIAYEGLTGTDLIETTLGSLEMVVDVVVFGGAALVLAYRLLTMKGKK